MSEHRSRCRQGILLDYRSADWSQAAGSARRCGGVITRFIACSLLSEHADGPPAASIGRRDGSPRAAVTRSIWACNAAVQTTEIPRRAQCWRRLVDYSSSGGTEPARRSTGLRRGVRAVSCALWAPHTARSGPAPADAPAGHHLRTPPGCCRRRRARLVAWSQETGLFSAVLARTTS